MGCKYNTIFKFATNFYAVSKKCVSFVKEARILQVYW